MKGEYTFEELTKLCREIGSKSGEGDCPPDTEGHTGEEAAALICSLQEAGAALQRMAYLLVAGGRLAMRIRGDAEMEEIEERQRAADRAIPQGSAP